MKIKAQISDKKIFWNKKRKDMLFYILMIALPILQFSIFYGAVNINSILLAFQSFDAEGNMSWIGFQQISSTLGEFLNPSDYTWLIALKNSLISYFVGLIFGVPLSLVFSYYIYKKMKFSRYFKLFLFLPSVVTGIVMILVFQYFANEALPLIFNLEQGLLSSKDTAFGTVLFYSIFTSFGTTVLLYSGAMNGVSPEMIESAKIDGISWWQEFRFIVLPTIYPTIVTFLVIGVATIFTNQLNLYSFFGETVQIDRGVTLGHYLFAETRYATLAQYPRLASIGIIFTLIAVPLTLSVKWFLEKIGPKEV
jgi:ABC-type sugar transport system permease subunit